MCSPNLGGEPTVSTEVPQDRFRPLSSQHVPRFAIVTMLANACNTHRHPLPRSQEHNVMQDA